MTRREAKRRACHSAAMLVEERLLAQDGWGFELDDAAFEVLQAAARELADELWRRAGYEAPRRRGTAP